MSTFAETPPAEARDTLWRAISITGLWFCSATALLLTGAAIVSTVIDWVKS
ncbi:hypothetical protein [Kaistia nematophila]|uniref:DUF2474 domain-containing protein n=1 Tax=Kaistia nematophila TaxID=2994654 RepID=A0A9X3E2M8_9HYPH|nr:hypothetical protein [Kaistia nematophila]MCX5570596.1 hypothetical protein [Kaistia nematophila]